VRPRSPPPTAQAPTIHPAQSAESPRGGRTGRSPVRGTRTGAIAAVWTVTKREGSAWRTDPAGLLSIDKSSSAESRMGCRYRYAVGHREPRAGSPQTGGQSVGASAERAGAGCVGCR
jgi:hypothetical protein